MNKKIEQKEKNIRINIVSDQEQFRKEIEYLKRYFGEKTDSKMIKKAISLIYENVT